jgi:hypothetical protein
MLNIYRYYDKSSDLPLYDKLNDAIDVVKELQNNDISMDKIDKDTLDNLMPIIKRIPKLAYQYVYYITQKRTPELEDAIKTNASSAYQYARKFMDGQRWIEAEPVIMQDPVEAADYAINVIKGRWLEAEPIISKDLYAWHDYIHYFEV